MCFTLKIVKHETSTHAAKDTCFGGPATDYILPQKNSIHRVTIPTVTYSAAPYVFLESKIWDPETLEFTSSAMAGDQLSWSIKLPGNFAVKMCQIC